MTLLRKLVVIQVALVTLGLAAFAFTSYKLYSDSQYQRVDGELHSVSPLLAHALADGDFSGGFPGSAPPGLSGAPSTGYGNSESAEGYGGAGASGGSDNLPPGSYVELRDQSGHVVSQHAVGCYSSTTCPTPKLSAVIVAPAGMGGRTFTTGATSGSATFRVLASTATSQLGGPGSADQFATETVVTAIPLGDVTRSLHWLLEVDLIVALAVILALSGTAFLVIRRGLHPLERMAGTARAIAKGDLSQRVTPADDRSEVGQLGLALNTMLTGIEDAFAERDATELRLRRFLADASHELRTPLTSIRGYAELFRMGAARTGTDLATVMQRIEEHAARMGVLVEDLLLLARLDQTRPAELSEVDLSVLAAEACDDVAATDPTRPIMLDAPDPVHVVGDEGHLRQAVGNLLANAIRHTPPGSPIEVGARLVGGVAVLTVRDHGAGLPEEGLAYAFDRFWQADASRSGGGAGLGLAIVAGVATEHGGQARVENAPDGGALFTIRLPTPVTAPDASHTLDAPPTEGAPGIRDAPSVEAAPAIGS